MYEILKIIDTLSIQNTFFFRRRRSIQCEVKRKITDRSRKDLSNISQYKYR